MSGKDKNAGKTSSSHLRSLIITLLFTLAIPSALLMWFGNLLMLNISKEGEENEHVPPTRWLASVLIPLTLAGMACIVVINEKKPIGFLLSSSVNPEEEPQSKWGNLRHICWVCFNTQQLLLPSKSADILFRWFQSHQGENGKEEED